MDDLVQGRLDAFALEVARECEGHATINRGELSGIRFLDVEPTSTRALRFSWIEYGGDGDGALQLQAGHHGGRWELEATMEDVQFIEDVARAVIAGHVVETFGPKRSLVEVTLLNGEVVRETGYDAVRGLIPMPGWRRRGRRVVYAPYRH